MSATNWADWLKTGAAILALPLAGLTFWLGYRQKEKERSKNYYHKVVVDVVLEPILTFFSEQIPNLQEAGTSAVKGMKGPRAAIPKSSAERLTRFSTGLFDVQDIVTARTAVFDIVATENLERRFQDLQDEVAQWFEDVGMHKRRNPEELTSILMSGQRELVKHIFEGQFRDFWKA